MNFCPECGRKIVQNAKFCVGCGYNLTSMIAKESAQQAPQKEEFDGIYKCAKGKKFPVYCPYCHSSKCTWVRDSINVPGETKTQYKLNLNPFKPFTIYDKKEKVVSHGFSIPTKYILCQSCGKTFR